VASRLDDLAQLLAPYSIAPEKLGQHQSDQPYHVSLSPYGLDLTLQCINLGVAELDRQWRLQSLTLHTAASNPANP
jgi:hypothetical protein